MNLKNGFCLQRKILATSWHKYFQLDRNLFGIFSEKLLVLWIQAFRKLYMKTWQLCYKMSYSIAQEKKNNNNSNGNNKKTTKTKRRKEDNYFARNCEKLYAAKIPWKLNRFTNKWQRNTLWIVMSRSVTILNSKYIGKRASWNNENFRANNSLGKSLAVTLNFRSFGFCCSFGVI